MLQLVSHLAMLLMRRAAAQQQCQQPTHSTDRRAPAGRIVRSLSPYQQDYLVHTYTHPQTYILGHVNASEQIRSRRDRQPYACGRDAGSQDTESAILPGAGHMSLCGTRISTLLFSICKRAFIAATAIVPTSVLSKRTSVCSSAVLQG